MLARFGALRRGRGLFFVLLIYLALILTCVCLGSIGLPLLLRLALLRYQVPSTGGCCLVWFLSVLASSFFVLLGGWMDGGWVGWFIGLVGYNIFILLGLNDYY
jgi:hypothetical protein